MKYVGEAGQYEFTVATHSYPSNTPASMRMHHPDEKSMLEAGWTLAWADRTENGTFYVFRRPTRT